MYFPVQGIDWKGNVSYITRHEKKHIHNTHTRSHTEEYDEENRTEHQEAWKGKEHEQKNAKPEQAKDEERC